MTTDSLVQEYYKTRGCKIKKMFTTRKQARKIAKIANTRYEKRVRAYKCLYGEHYHIGHPRPPYKEKQAEYKARQMLKNSI